jgi:hypothetical protein
MSPKTVLKERRNDVLAAGGDQELSLATGDLREPLLVEQSDIARCGTIRRRGRSGGVSLFRSAVKTLREAPFLNITNLRVFAADESRVQLITVSPHTPDVVAWAAR